MRRQRRGFQALALILGLALFAAACGGDDDEGGEGSAPEEEATEESVPDGGTLVLGAEQEPECLDWIASCSGASWGYWAINVHTMPRAYEIVQGEDGESWEYQPGSLLEGEAELQEDPMITTYQISEEAIWSDETPITCADFAYTWDQIANGEDIYDRTGYDRIESVECTEDDPKNVVVNYSEPYSGWKHLFGGQYGILPAHILEGEDRAALMTDGYDFSGGPWLIESWERGSQVTLVPNENYWGQVPHLDEVVFRFIANTSAEFEAFRAGEVAAIYPQPQLDAVEQINQGIEGAESIITDVTPNTEALYLNNAEPPFDSVAVRQAFAYAIDRGAIVERLFGGIGIEEPLNSFNATILGDFGNPDAFAGYEQDLDQVEELMTGDGWERNADDIWEKDGQTATIEFKTTAGNARRELTQQVVQEQAAEAGFEVTINNREAGDLFGTDLPAGDYQMALYAQVMTDLDPSNCNLYCSQNIPSAENDNSGQNWTRTDVEGLDEPLLEVDTLLDRDAQSEAQAEADDIMAEAVVSIPLDPLPNIVLWNDTILGPVGEHPIYGPFYNMNEWGVAS